MISEIACLATSRPSVTNSSVGAAAPSCMSGPGDLGGLALDHEDVDAALVVLAAGHDHVERGLVELLVAWGRPPLAADQRRCGRRPPGRRTAGRPASRPRAAPFSAAMSYGLAMSTCRIMTTTWTSSRKPSLKVGPQRAVDQARGQGRRLGRPALAAEEAAGDLAHGVHPLLDVDGEREEVDALAGLRADAGGEDLGLAVVSDAAPRASCAILPASSEQVGPPMFRAMLVAIGRVPPVVCGAIVARGCGRRLGRLSVVGLGLVFRALRGFWALRTVRGPRLRTDLWGPPPPIGRSVVRSHHSSFGAASAAAARVNAADRASR